MSWRESSGRESCNRCHSVVNLGAPVYVGEVTPSFWCEGCAGTVLGQAPDGPCPKVRAVAGGGKTFDVAAIADKFPAFAKAMHAIEARASMRVLSGRDRQVPGE